MPKAAREVHLSRKIKEHEGVYAILRWDRFHDADTPFESRVTVKEVVRSLRLAEAEVARLNALDKTRAVYWWQYTRLFPAGHSAGTTTHRSADAWWSTIQQKWRALSGR